MIGDYVDSNMIVHSTDGTDVNVKLIYNEKNNLLIDIEVFNPETEKYIESMVGIQNLIDMVRGVNYDN